MQLARHCVKPKLAYLLIRLGRLYKPSFIVLSEVYTRPTDEDPTVKHAK